MDATPGDRLLRVSIKHNAMRYFLIIGFILTVFCAKSQEVYVPTPQMRYPEHKIAYKPCRLTAFYRYEFYADTLRNGHFYDRYALDVGDNMTYFYSLYAAKCDSIAYQGRLTKDDRGVPMRNWMQVDQRENYEDYLVNYPSQGELTALILIAGRDYEYTESLPQHQWVVSPNDTLQIAGYTCWKATTRFRGREWTAWYAPELPLPYGPWKLVGLPGLIMKAYDDQKFFDFTLEEIHTYTNKERYIYIYDSKKNKAQKSTRKTISKLMELRWKDPVGLVMSTTGLKIISISNTASMELKSGDTQYCPIPELELDR